MQMAPRKARVKIGIFLCLYAGATPPASSPGTCALPVPTLEVLLQLRPPHNCVNPPAQTSASARTPPRYPFHRTCMKYLAVATVPFNPDVLELPRLAYPSRTGTEIESAELPNKRERPKPANSGGMTKAQRESWRKDAQKAAQGRRR